MNLFYLAEYYLQVIKGKIPDDKNYDQEVITTAVKIRKWFNKVERNTTVRKNQMKNLLKEIQKIKR